MDFKGQISEVIQDGSSTQLDFRQVLEVCISCVRDGRQPDPRVGRPGLEHTVRVVEVECSTHQRDRR